MIPTTSCRSELPLAPTLPRCRGRSRGGIVVVSGPTRYESALDTDAQTIIEENGPVRAVIRSSGVLRNAAGARHVAYTAHLHFHEGAAAVRAFVTRRNGELASVSPKNLDAAWVELPVRLGGHPSARG